MTYEVYLAHHGIKGQRWGVRRYQNEDGSYTEAGKKRYLKTAEKSREKWDKKFTKAKKRANSVILRHPVAMGGGYTAWAQRRKVRSARRARKSYEKAVEVFKEDSASLKKKGFSDPEIDRYNDLASAFLKKRDFYSSDVKKVEKRSFQNYIDTEAAADFKAKQEAKKAKKNKG